MSARTIDTYDAETLAASSLADDLLKTLAASGFDGGLRVCILFNALFGLLAERYPDRAVCRREFLAHVEIALDGFDGTDFMDFLPKEKRN